MLKRALVLIMCFAFAVTGTAIAEGTATEVVFDHFIIKVGKVKKNGDKFEFDFAAYFDEQELMRRYDFSFYPFDYPADGSDMYPTDTQGVVKYYDSQNSLGHINNICFLHFLTADGEPFMHPRKDASMMQDGGGQLPDGRWYKPIKFTTHTLYPNEKGVNVEFHVLNETQPYPSEETFTSIYVELP